MGVLRVATSTFWLVLKEALSEPKRDPGGWVWGVSGEPVSAREGEGLGGHVGPRSLMLSLRALERWMGFRLDTGWAFLGECIGYFVRASVVRFCPNLAMQCIFFGNMSFSGAQPKVHR